MESIPSPVKPTQDVLPLPLPKELAKYKHKDFEISTTLGTGTFGRVKLAQHLQTGIFYAVKIMIKSEIIRLNQLTHVQSEVDVLMRIEHPFIVKMAGFYQTDTNLCIVTEYLEGGELFSLLREQTRFPIETVRLYSSQILLAIEYLHSMGLVHRDIKPDNVLVRDRRSFVIKVADFGADSVSKFNLNLRRWRLRVSSRPPRHRRGAQAAARSSRRAKPLQSSRRGATSSSWTRLWAPKCMLLRKY